MMKVSFEGKKKKKGKKRGREEKQGVVKQLKRNLMIEKIGNSMDNVRIKAPYVPNPPKNGLIWGHKAPKFRPLTST